jgi:serine/threonine-protein kinase
MSGPGLCEGGPERVAAVWSAERQAKAEQAFAATKLPYAADAWTGTAALLDGYAREWAGMYAEACAATQLRGEQSAELMDLRMTCLQRRLRDMDALLVLFEGADKAVVKRAAEAAAALPGVQACADAEALRNGASAPRPTVDATVVEALRERLRTARAKATAGKAKEAVTELEAIAGEATGLAEPSLTAAAKLALARAQMATGADEAAGATAAAAVWQAIADRDDETLSSALEFTIFVVGYKLGRAAEAKPWIEHAQAVLRRRGSPDGDKGDLLHEIGLVAIAAGDHEGAVAPLTEAISLLERVHGPEDHRLIEPLNGLGAARLRSGKYAEAQALLERALAIAEKTRGPAHPELAFPLNNLALSLERQNRYEESIAALRRTRDILAAINPDDPNVALVRQNIGGILHLSGKSAEAKGELKAAIEHFERTIGGEHPAVAGAWTFTGDVERALGDLAAARAAYTRACSIREKALGAEHPDLALCLLGLAEVDLAEAKFSSALAQADRALAVVAKGSLDPGDLGLMQFARAKALRATGAPGKAKEAAVAAREAFVKAGPAGEKGLGELTRWEAE